MVCIKDSLLLIIWLDIDIVKTLTDVQLSKVASFLELGDQFRDQEK